MRKTKVKRDIIRNVMDFLKWEPILAEEQRKRLLSVPRPVSVRGVLVPEDINGLSLEDLFKLWNIKTVSDLFFVGASVVLGLSERDVRKADFLALMGFANWLSSELQRVSELWSDMPSSKTPEEVQAGAPKFGTFGIVDYYARRMGMTNHDQALQTQWVRVYQCMRNDAEEAEYRKRLARIQSKVARRK